jgi:ADP-heptose:LPS heptosyltransferase
MSAPLQISRPAERWLVRAADNALAPLRWRRRPPPSDPIARILLLRLERIGDLLMVLDAIDDVRRAWPDAVIDLAVGAWNAPLARLIAGVSRVEPISVPWLARQGEADSWPHLVARARGWRDRHYDLVLNFEPDVRSNLLAWLSGAPRRVGYDSGGGGPFLTDAAPYAPDEHVSVNARQLVARAAAQPVNRIARPGVSASRLQLPEAARAQARTLLGQASGPLVGVHASGGRPSKQWHPDRFAAAARELARSRDATIVLTGASGDAAIVADVRRGLGAARVIDATGALDLPGLAAVLASLDVLITGDTGPMHLAAAVGTPIVALFGPSNPARYGPMSRTAHVLRVDLPCSPCGQVRLPPRRCRGRVPECLDRIATDQVIAAALEVLDARRPLARRR